MRSAAEQLPAGAVRGVGAGAAAGLNEPRIEIADYDPARDADAVKRIWREVGWIDADSEHLVPRYFECGSSVVFRIDGSAECAVHATPGAMRYREEDLQLAAITGVTTSRVARKLGAAQRLTARSLAAAAEAGAEVSALGMFEQGFYDRLGFGTGTCEHYYVFDPASLQPGTGFRPPCRLTKEDWADVHQCMTTRLRGHGECVLEPSRISECELGWTDDAFGLGYRDAPDGRLSHFIWGEAAGEHGPYRITWTAYRSVAQLFELLALIRSLGDQVGAVEMLEPPNFQLQDVLRQPFRHRRNTGGGKFANRCEAAAHWQARMLDVQKCLAKTRLSGQDLTFNLKLSDPAPAHLEDGAAWAGAGGDFIVTLGTSSGAERGEKRGLPTMQATVGAFTRMWLGVAGASVLAATDALKAPPSLLGALDEKLALPAPRLGWDF